MATRATKKASGTSGKAVKTAKRRVPAAATKKAPAKKKAPTKVAPTKAAAAKKKASTKDAPAEKKAPTKKASAKKGSAKKAPSKKAPSKKAPSDKVPAKPRAVATEKRRVRGGATGGSAAVDAYVERLEAWQREVIDRVRGLVREMAPEAAESIKWGQPVFEQGGPFAYVRPAGSHVTFGFWRGAELDDPSGVLEGAGDRMRHVKIHEADEIDAATLGAFVRHAVALNRRHGNPAAIRRV